MKVKVKIKIKVRVKVKVELKVKVRVHHHMAGQPQRGGGSIALTHSQNTARKRRMVSTTLRPPYSWKRPSTLCT